MPSRRALTALLAATVLASAALVAPAFAADPGVSGPPSGRITLQAKGAAVGVGYTWGDGTLTFRGKRYPFTVNGVTIADVGFSRVTGRGRVYHLNKLEDFNGTYVAATGEATAGRGIGGQILQNASGVQIRVDDITRGVRLQGSADGIKLTLK